jgi:putative membrane protein insertion efficiency factor
MKQADRLVRIMLRGYQRVVSPLLPHACRYVPTCSEYALEAVERHGALRGGLLAAWRLLRCHPFAGHGYDPVPDSWKREALKGRGFSRAVTRSHSVVALATEGHAQGRTHKYVFTDCKTS